MAISDLVGKVFSSQFLMGVKQNTSYMSALQDRSSEISDKGNGLVIALNQGLVSVADYPPAGTDITYSNLVPTHVDFTLDKEKYIAFQIEDTNRAQIAYNLFQEAARQAGQDFSIQLSADTRAMFQAAIDAAGFPGSQEFEIELDSNAETADERESLVLLIYDMKAKLGTDGYEARPVMFTHPSTYKLLLKYALVDKGMSLPSQANKVFVDGGLSSLLGVDIIVDWGQTIDSTNSNDNADSYMFIRNRTAMYAGQVSRIENMRAEGRFADRWRGLNTYGVAIQETRSLLGLFQTVK